MLMQPPKDLYKKRKNVFKNTMGCCTCNSPPPVVPYRSRSCHIAAGRAISQPVAPAHGILCIPCFFIYTAYKFCAVLPIDIFHKWKYNIVNSTSRIYEVTICLNMVYSDF